MNNTTRLERLNHLLDVALVHEEHDGHDTPLNGGCYNLDMSSWKCGTSACLLGSYVLTDYGKRFFDWVENSFIPEPKLRVDNTNDPYQDAAKHFGISFEDSTWLFCPDEYDGCPRNDEGHIPADIVAERVHDIIAKYSDFNVQGVTSERQSSGAPDEQS